MGNDQRDSYIRAITRLEDGSKVLMTSNPRLESLIAALSQARIPAANHEFIRSITNTAGVAGYRVVDQRGKPYVIATRSNGLRDLHIYYGATSGFASEDEVISIAGAEMGRGESGTRKGTWYVLHPVNEARVGGERGRDVRRAGMFCTCGMQLSLTGVCANCS